MARSEIEPMCETVLITGVGGPAGRAGASYFAKKGYRVVGTDMREVASPATDFRFVPAARDPRFVPVLLAIAVQEKAALVVSTVTEELPVVARMRQALRERGVALSISDPWGVDVANDKLRTAEGLDRAGVPVPVTFSSDTPHQELADALGFPLLSKPRFGRGGRGVVVHRGAEDLACASPEEVVWQEFLPGEEYDLNLFVERDGSVPAAVVLRKTGLKEGLVGNALGVERVERPDVAGLGMRAARSLGLEGPIDMDIRLSADGNPAVLEVNARLGANVLSASEVLDALDEAWRNGRCA
jgi:carbamoyl-phosphate synthase large subunit